MYYSPRKKKNFFGDRLGLVVVFFAAAMAIIILRLFVLQIIRGGKYQEMAIGSHNIFTDIAPDRGDILIADDSGKSYPIATNQTLYLVYMEPRKIQNKTAVAEALSTVLEMDKAALTEMVKGNELYKIVAHYVSPQKVQALKKYSLSGIGFNDEPKRIYPEQGFSGQILGFVGKDAERESGRYGIEGYFNDELAGKEGYIKGEKDALGRLIPWGKQETAPSINGTDLTLTIDRNVQFFVCKTLRDAVKQFEAESGSVIVMNPATGAILGMCSVPDYDPNIYNKVADQSVFKNPAIFNQFEPGSIFKPITMAIGVDLKLVNPETTYEDTGVVQIGPYAIRNSDLKSNGAQTMTQVLEKSLNTGVIYVVRKIGAQKFNDYVENFGFGALTGVELDREASGDVSSLKKRGDIWSATASFGQGVAVTPIQILNAFNVIANGGRLMKPQIIAKFDESSGAEQSVQPKAIRQVISERSAALLRGMLVNVVENGHGKRAGVPGYYVAGKTGTAQVSKAGGGGYESGRTIGSFIGFAPADNPVFSMLVKIDNPKTVQWAESSAAPIFGTIAKYLLNYYKVPSER
jgi:cell division protein FtsI (penicillin-binding protein 3)/stage V sporulation protein D (sporulation-specific penicillin-binding protein)